MPSLSRRSKERLDTCRPALQEVFNELIKTYDFAVLCGFRDKEEQEQAYKIGTTKCHFPNSRHNTYPSEAIDVAPYWEELPHIRWGSKLEYKNNDNLQKTYATYDEYSKACVDEFDKLSEKVMDTACKLNIDLEWGGDWPSLRDMPHYQLKR